MDQHLTGIVWLDAFLAVMGAWGYAVAFAGALLENLFIAGSFMPGETVVMAVSFVASKDPRLNLGAVWSSKGTSGMRVTPACRWCPSRSTRRCPRWCTRRVLRFSGTSSGVTLT